MGNEPDLVRNGCGGVHDPSVFRMVGLREGGRLEIAVCSAQEIFLGFQAEDIRQGALVDSDIAMLRVLGVEEGRGEVLEQSEDALGVRVLAEEGLGKGTAGQKMRQNIPKLVVCIQDASCFITQIIGWKTSRGPFGQHQK